MVKSLLRFFVCAFSTAVGARGESRRGNRGRAREEEWVQDVEVGLKREEERQGEKEEEEKQGPYHGSCVRIHTCRFRGPESGMRGDGDTSVCISAAEPPLEKRERGRGKKGGEASTRKVGEPTHRRDKEGEKSEAAEGRLAEMGGQGVEKRRTTPATARLNANSFIDWISKSPSFDSCSTFSRA